MKTVKLLICCLPAFAPAAPCYGQGAYAIRNAKIVTVSGPTIAQGTVVIKDGVIADLGQKIAVPSGAQVIDGRGLTVYPGLFDSNTRIGLTEIGQVPVTSDFSEMGEYMPHLLAFTAVHVESEHIPVARAAGITHVLTRPSGGTVPGQAAIISLHGWSPQEMEITRHGAMLLNYPSLFRRGGGGFGGFGFGQARRTYSEIKKEYDNKVRELKGLLAKARHYGEAREKAARDGDVAPGDKSFFPDKQLEALIPVVQGRQAVLIEANSHVDIKNAAQFAREEKLNYVVLGAIDAWKVADFLKENQVRVILGPRQALPVNEDDPIDIMYRTPAVLHEKGVPFAISTGDSSNSRTLPFEVGNAVAHGLPYDVALRSVTLTPAEFLGVADRVGSIDKGKKANLVVATGDIFEYQTQVKHLFINGQPVSLETKHTKLYEKYIQRP